MRKKEPPELFANEAQIIGLRWIFLFASIVINSYQQIPFGVFGISKKFVFLLNDC